MMDFQYKNVHMIGIGGISMSGIAKLLVNMGVEVTGSDVNESQAVGLLRELGVNVFIGHSSKNISAKTDLVVVTAAIPKDNPELMQAIKMDLPVFRRSQLIGLLMKEKIGICIAGMHGKSTTTSIVAELLVGMGEDPTVLAGANIKSLKSNFRSGKSDILVAEACEYNRSFLDFEPTIAVVLNIEEEHLDTYRNLDDIMDSFKLYCQKVPDNGMVVGCLDDQNVFKLMHEVNRIKVGYGFADKPKEFDGVYWQIIDYKNKDGKSIWKVRVDNDNWETVFEIPLPGKFNVLNATAALVVTDFLLLDMKETAKVLKQIHGGERRFDVLGKKDGVVVVDDYGHHPTEIKNSIMAARDFFPEKKLWVVFWPHQYNRTEQFWNGFIGSFDNVDELIIMDVYEARVCDTDKTKYNSKILTEKIAARGVSVQYLKTEDKVIEYLKKNIAKNSVLLTQGAGPVDRIAKVFLN